MTDYAASERDGLADALTAAGPDAPTLCEGWQARHLAAHVILRDRRPDLMIGMIVPPLAGRLERSLQSLATQPFDGLVEQVREGAQAWNLVGTLMEGTVNEVEFYVHHEDVLRARPGFTARALPDDQARALWSRIAGAARLALRRSPVGIVLVAPGYGRANVVSRSGASTVVVTGAPQELLLWVYGRRAVADVELEGTPEALAALTDHRFGV